MTEDTLLYLLHVLGFAGFLWLGYYALTRGARGSTATLTGAAALITACFFFSGGLTWALHGAPATEVINRITWWTDVAPIPIWLHLSMALTPRAAAARWRWPAVLGGYAGGGVLVLLGTGGDLLRGPVGGAGPLYPLYVAYLFVCVGGAVVSFVTLNHSTVPPPGPTAAAVQPPPLQEGALGVRRTEARLLVVGTLCFLAGAGYLALDNLIGYRWRQLPAYALLLVGLSAVGMTVALRGALLLGADVRRDFLYSVTGLAALLVPYLAADNLLLGSYDLRHSLFTLLVTGLITTGHTLDDAARSWLDHAFFTPVVREERAAARAYVEALATQPVGPHPELATPKAFEDAVRRALTNLSDPTKLASSPLLTLRVVSQDVTEGALEDNRLNRAAVLREIMLDLLEGLRGSGGSPTADARRYYNCLYYPYARGLGRRRAPAMLRQLAERRRREGGPRGELEQVLEWLLQVDEDTFYKWQRRGSDTIAAALCEREAATGGATPQASQPEPLRLADTPQI